MQLAGQAGEDRGQAVQLAQVHVKARYGSAQWRTKGIGCTENAARAVQSRVPTPWYPP